MGIKTAKELDTKALYKARGFVSISPVSKGTFTVAAGTTEKGKKFTGLTFEDVPGAVLAAFSWLDDQIS